MTYNITYNAKFNSHEVYFDGKPSEAVRAALKELKFRWHSVKRCWYGYSSEEIIAAAITGTTTEEEPASVIGEGYLGGGAIYGSKSNRYLHGTDLSAAIRADIKNAGIKGVTVKVKTYAGGQSITATVTLTPDDLIPFDQYLENYRISGSTAWIHFGDGEYIHAEKYWASDTEEQERIRRAAAAYEYSNATTKENAYHNTHGNHLTPEAKAKVSRVDALIAAYRYDCSNGMVDYFDTNFYYDIYLKPAEIELSKPTD